ncbi:MAG: dipeptidase [Acidobacteria bacterium]|nr:MAG: dipeptidase [Acidobacteria bacterium 13_2_20CM_58_27]PYT86191.1 MAG: dipeptidase [Acidobacteriota bacterium]
MNRRSFLKTAGGGVGLAATMVNRGRYLPFAGGPEYSARAIELVERSTVIDMLAPLWISPSKTMKMLGNPDNFTSEDYAPYKDCGINVFHIAIGTGGPDAYLETLKFLSGYDSFLARHDAWFARVDTPSRLDGIKASGKVGILLGIQNSEHFRKVDDVDYFYGLGQRVSQLTYNARTLIGNGSTERRDDGLSDFGVAIVERMNKVGMAVDVSHCGDTTTLDAFQASKKPVLITHANCRALNPNHPRCKTDEAIKAMAAKGGVMGITEVRMFVSPTEPTGLDAMLDHYDHVRKLVGVEHVGVGSDIDLLGYDAMPPDEYKQLKAGYKSSYGFRDKIDIDGYTFAKRPFDLAEGLIRRKYGDADVEAILGGNFRRVLKEIWTV